MMYTDNDGNIWFPRLCGDSNGSIYQAFWNNNLTVNTFNPDLPECFQKTVLEWLPITFLWIACIFYIPYLTLFPTIHPRGYLGKLTLFKLISISALVILKAADLIYYILQWTSGSRPVYLVDFIGPSLEIVTFIFAGVLTHITFRKAIHSSGVLFTFWLLSTLLAIIPFRSKIIRLGPENGVSDYYTFTSFFIYFALVLAHFISCLFTDYAAITRPGRRRSERTENTPLLAASVEEEPPIIPGNRPCPKLTAPFLSVLFFWWFTPTILLGYKRPLTDDDIWDIREEDSCDTLVPRFNKEWEKERNKVGSLHKKTTYVPKPIQTEPNGKPRLKSGDTLGDLEFVPSEQRYKKKGEEADEQKPKKSPSLVAALNRTFGGYFFTGAFLLVVFNVMQFINPLILNLLITFIQTEDQYTWRGYLYAVAMFFASILGVLCMHHQLNIAYTVGMRVRTVLTDAIYEKTLKLSPSFQGQSTTGEIVNLMSVDVQKLQDAANFINYLWGCPISLALSLYFLYNLIGPAVFAGLAFMITFLPLQSIYVGKKIRELQKKQMKLKDERIKLMNQILSGIKVLKLYAWEPFFMQRVLDLRNKELKNLKKMATLNAVTYMFFFSSPFLVALLCFTTYVLSDPTNILDAQTAFVSMSLINLLNFPLTILPMSIMLFVACNVSLGRIQKYLLTEEIDPNNVQHEFIPDGPIRIQDGCFSWGQKDRITLKDINMRVGHGKLVAIVGTVGSGKSSLLAALLGEMEKHVGSVNVNGALAYVPQQAWIQNMSLKDNILFARPMLNTRYKQVLQSCALEPDLKILPGGDETEIGERGINLSGGQKARVSLARAVYQDSDIYLLDDPLSAVDAHVGKHIFNEVIGPEGMLRNKTRVLVTNGLTFLPKVDEIFVVKDGTIVEQGSYDQLINKDGGFAEFVRTYLTEKSDAIDSEDEDIPEQLIQLKKQISVLSGEDPSETKSEKSGSQVKSGSHLKRRKRKSTVKSKKSDKELIQEEEKNVQKKSLVTEESAEVGAVSLSVLVNYVKAAGIPYFICTIVGLCLFIASQVGTNIWLSIWSNDIPVNGTNDRQLLDLRLGLYGGLGGVQTISVLLLGLSIAFGAVAASRSLHHTLLANIVKCPMSFFDTTPLGRIVNRFSKDIDVVDSNIPQFTQNLMTTLAPLFSTIIVISYSTPIFIAVVVPLGIFFVVLQRVYVACARQIKRVDSIKRSPIYAFFSETLNGTSSIRAYNQNDRFLKHSQRLVDEQQRVWFEVFSSNRWIGVYAEFIGDIIVFFTAIFSVYQRDKLDAGLVGLSLSFALQVSMNLIMTVRSSCELETYIVAVERIIEYTESPTEAPWKIQSKQPPRGWPEHGEVQFKNYSTRYREGLDLVLKGVNCTFKPTEKVGIVGRTGAGKSSMTLALFRLIEAAGGRIEIDGQDIAVMGLHDVRNQLTIIPQDPVLFSGTLRFNIDPSENFSDDEVWAALEHAHLKTFVSTLPLQLYHECGEDGKSLSVGQRQLVCLARALLRRAKILVLDEATAAVDMETDDLIQKTIWSAFKEYTVITIAHRLNTIIDYDRVLIMDKGEVTEFDSPDALLKDKNSMFYAMARDAGIV